MLLQWIKNNTLSKLATNISELNDEQLMCNFAQNGQQKWLNELLSRHGDALYHFALSLAGIEMAADIAQTSWLKVIEKRTFFQPEHSSFKAWLFTIARNHFFDQNKKAANQQAQHQQIQEHTAPASLPLCEQISATQKYELFNQLLDALPHSQKEAFMLQQEGFSLAQIATITGANQETVKTRLRYARAHFSPISNQLKETT